MTIASIGVLASCLFMIGNFYLISLNLQENIKSLQDTNQMQLFIEDAASDERITQIQTEITAIENVATCEYISRESALEEYESRYPDDKDLFSGLDSTFMPRSFRVTLKDLNLYDETLYRFTNIQNVYKVNSDKDVVENMLSIGRIVRYISIWIMGLMLLASIFIIVNTIRLASFYYRRQINIMKYIGATNWFIRWPFLIHGAFIGFLSGVLTYFFQKFTYVYVFEALATHIPIIHITSYSKLDVGLLLSFLAGGLLVGIAGSGISIGKYLKV